MQDRKIKAPGRGLLTAWASVLVLSVGLASSSTSVLGQDATTNLESALESDAALGSDAGASLDASDAESDSSETSLLLAIGAPGTDEYAKEFEIAAQAWRDLAKMRGWTLVEIAPTEAQETKQLFSSAIESTYEQTETWIVMIGHGTFARNVAKFNLVGPDVSANELEKWLAPSSGRVVLVHAFSCSGPFLQQLSAKNRILLSATKSGAEYNYARFGKFLGQSIADLTNDLDHDNAVSLLEAFLAANNLTQRFYTEEARLATEHALLSDNGDQFGTPGEFFTGVRPTKEADGGSPIDGRQASRVILFTSPDSPIFSDELDEQRVAIEDEIDRLRKEKEFLGEADYLNELEQLMLKLAGVYETAESNSGGESRSESDDVQDQQPEPEAENALPETDAKATEEPESSESDTSGESPK